MQETQMKGTGNRFLIIDIIKAYGAVAVIMTHVSGITNQVKATCLWPFTILPAVPLFLMCSIFVLCYSEDRKQGDVLSWFSNTSFWKRISRILWPYLIAIGVLLLGLVLFRNMRSISSVALFQILQQGGRGPGGYYVMVVLQLMVSFPFARSAYQKSQMGTVAALVLLQIAYEQFCIRYSLNEKLYDILIFRYLTHIALGFLLYSYYEKLKGTAIPAVCIIVGTIYLINVYYLGYEQHLVYRHDSRSMIAVLYSFGVLCYALRLERYLQFIERHAVRTSLIRGMMHALLYIGKASLHIMLTQMVWFYFARMFNLEAQLGSWKLAALVDVAVCVSVGCLFFALDNYSRKLFSNLRKKVK